jgi:hypothetical protein
VAGATLPLLVTLVNKSWLTYDRPGDRYHLHELLRQYGRRQLAAQPAAEQAACERHAAYYAARLHARAADFTSARQRETVAEIQAELANVERAWDWALQSGDAGLLSQCLESLARFYEWTGRAAEGEAALGRAAGRLAALAPSAPPEVSRLWARTLTWQSRFAAGTERQRALLAKAQAALERLPANKLDLRGDWAWLHLCLGESVYRRDRQRAATFYAQALDHYQALDSRAGVAACLQALGAARWAQGHLDQAAQDLEASLALQRELEDQRGIAGVLGTLALVRKHQGLPAEAERLHREVVESCQRLGSRPGERVATTDLAHTLAETGQFDEMLAVARRGVALAQDLGRYHVFEAQLTAAHALQHLGQYADAGADLLQVAGFAREAGLQQMLGLALCWLGQVTSALGDHRQAAQWLAESGAILAELRQNVLAIPVAWLSYTFRAQGDARQARQQLGRALRQANDRRTVLSLRDCLLIAALLAADESRLERAAELHALSQTFGYIAHSRWYADVAGRYLDETVTRLPAAVAQAAVERGRALDPWQTALALTADFPPPA